MKQRKATMSASDEVRLAFTIEVEASSLLNGTPGIVFYSLTDYRKKQERHGHALYPEPTQE